MKVKDDCANKLATKRNAFNMIKKDMAEIEATENKLKEEIDKLI